MVLACWGHLFNVIWSTLFGRFQINEMFWTSKEKVRKHLPMSNKLMHKSNVADKLYRGHLVENIWSTSYR